MSSESTVASPTIELKSESCPFACTDPLTIAVVSAEKPGRKSRTYESIDESCTRSEISASPRGASEIFP